MAHQIGPYMLLMAQPPHQIPGSISNQALKCLNHFMYGRHKVHNLMAKGVVHKNNCTICTITTLCQLGLQLRLFTTQRNISRHESSMLSSFLSRITTHKHTTNYMYTCTYTCRVCTCVHSIPDSNKEALDSNKEALDS